MENIAAALEDPAGDPSYEARLIGTVE